MPRGCVHGAYGLLEQLGCRFYGPAPFGLVLPKQATLSIPDALNVKREPSFRHRYVPGSSLIPDMFPTGGTPQEHLQWGYSHTRVAANAEEIARLSQMGFAQYRFVHLWPELLAKRFSADGGAPQRRISRGTRTGSRTMAKATVGPPARRCVSPTRTRWPGSRRTRRTASWRRTARPTW